MSEMVRDEPAVGDGAVSDKPDREATNGTSFARFDDTGFEPDAEIELSDGSRSGGRGTIITLTTVIALLLATALTVLGLGAADTAVANFDANAWLWSSPKGELDRVSGVTAKVDTRTKLNDSQNHEIEVSQTDKYLILRDLQTGQVTALDLTTLQVSAVMPTTPGFGVSVALHGETAFVIDSVFGQVRQLDPRSLAPTGDAVTLPKGIKTGGFDGKGLLWIGVPTEGTVVAIEPGKDAASPKVVRTVTVSSPNHDYELSPLDVGVAVLDNTEQKLAVVNEKAETVDVPITKPGILPARTVGDMITVTVPDDRKVVLVNGRNVRQITIEGGTGPIGPTVYYAGRLYAPDSRSGLVHETDLGGKVLTDIKMPTSTGKVELQVRESYLFINTPDGPSARVVDDKHTVREVNKFQDGVLGGDPPPPPPPVEPPPPPVGVPGAAQNVTSAGGNQTATITWRRAADNGLPITKYVVEGAGQQIVVGASQRSVDITGLTNGETYRFTVYAINEQGAGPRAAAPPVTPTREVPDPPAGVTATANPDGTVVVTWQPANGQGHPIASYRVTSITGGVTAPVGSVTETTITLAKGATKLGTQYAFTVVAINDTNAASEASAASNVVIPFTPPGAPVNISGATVPDQKGTIRIQWQAAAANGRPVTKYVVSWQGGSRDVTGATAVNLNGFPDDTAVTVRVKAVNAAGEGPEATTSARTIGAPSVAVTAENGSYRQVGVTFTPNNRGGNATCVFTVTNADGGAQSAQAGCNTQPVTLTVGTGVWPNGNYSYTVTITNPAGSATATGSMPSATMRFTVSCTNQGGYNCNGGVWAYPQPNQNGSGVEGLANGATRTPECYTSGQNINAVPWGAKQSNIWLRYQRNGNNTYFPWAWAYLDGGDNLGNLKPC